MFTSAFFIAAGIVLAVLISGFTAYNYGVRVSDRRWSYVVVWSLIALFSANLIVGIFVGINESYEASYNWEQTCLQKGGDIVSIGSDGLRECFKPGYEIIPIP